MTSSILTSVESKLQEMKTTLVSAFDNSKTYSEAVQKSQIVIVTSSADEGYFNNTHCMKTSIYANLQTYANIW